MPVPKDKTKITLDDEVDDAINSDENSALNTFNKTIDNPMKGEERQLGDNDRSITLL